jgi:hypothetical protein
MNLNCRLLKSGVEKWQVNLQEYRPIILASRWVGKKAELPYSRQPGYLFETRGFPSPPRSGFGFF